MNETIFSLISGDSIFTLLIIENSKFPVNTVLNRFLCTANHTKSFRCSNLKVHTHHKINRCFYFCHSTVVLLINEFLKASFWLRSFLFRIKDDKLLVSSSRSSFFGINKPLRVCKLFYCLIIGESELNTNGTNGNTIFHGLFFHSLPFVFGPVSSIISLCNYHLPWLLSKLVEELCQIRHKHLEDPAKTKPKNA